MGLSLTGCGSGNGDVIKQEDYDNSCTVSTDCMWIKLGATCDCCEFGAINNNDKAKYNEDRGDPSSCDPALPPYAEPEVDCEDGTCVVVE